MRTRALLCLTAVWLAWVGPASAQSRAATDSDFARSAGRWAAPGVSFQSGGTSHQFVVEAKRVGNLLEVTLPKELALPGGQVYQLVRTGRGVFQHVDAVGRIVQFTRQAANRATLLITGTWGSGRVTWQLAR